MFYQCAKCEKTWQYPLPKCPECFSELKRMESGSVKVIGSSRTSIPTILHPKAPYFVLVLEDENGNRWAQKSVREYKIGDHIDPESSQNRESIAIWRIKYDISEGINKVIEMLGGLKINSASKILVMPTIAAPTHAYLRDNTSPEFLEETLKILFQEGAKPENIKVASQSFDEIAIEASAQRSGLLGICQKYKILPSDLSKTEFIRKNKGNLAMEISGEILNSDLIINLPILKMGKAGATENIFKSLKRENYFGLKYLYSDQDIIGGLNEFLPPTMTIAEANVVQKEDRFTSFLGWSLAGFNTLNLDRIFAQATLQKSLPEVLKDIKMENIPILGRSVEEISFKP